VELAPAFAPDLRERFSRSARSEGWQIVDHPVSWRVRLCPGQR
jgi:hypothetical protein